jgi:hypothetical protein
MSHHRTKLVPTGHHTPKRVPTDEVSTIRATEQAVAAILDLEILPPLLDGRQLALLLDCSYWSVMEGAKRGDLPIVPLRIGRLVRFSTAAVLRVLSGSAA